MLLSFSLYPVVSMPITLSLLIPSLLVRKCVTVYRAQSFTTVNLANDQLDAQMFNTIITILYMYMFRAISCSSSGGKIVSIQHLVPSFSVSDLLMHRLRKNCFAVLSQPVHRTVTYWEWRYQMLYWYNFTSWGWARYCSKHVRVEDGNKYIKHLCINSFIDTNLIHNFFYINYIKLSSSTFFERHPLIFRGPMMLIVHVCSLWYSHSLQVAVLCTC